MNQSSKKRKILIVDDSVELAKAMADMLTFRRYDVVVAHSGTEAIEAALKEHPDLILLDLRMPDMDGFEVIRRLQKDAWGATVKILMLTNDGTEAIPPDIRLAQEDFLLKSRWGLDNIQKKIKEKLTGRRLPARE